MSLLRIVSGEVSTIINVVVSYNLIRLHKNETYPRVEFIIKIKNSKIYIPKNDRTELATNSRVLPFDIHHKIYK